MKDEVNESKNGEYYKTPEGGIDAITYITANDMGFVEGNIIKYVARLETKNTTLEGKLEDLSKIKHYVDILTADTIAKHSKNRYSCCDEATVNIPNAKTAEVLNESERGENLHDIEDIGDILNYPSDTRLLEEMKRKLNLNSVDLLRNRYSTTHCGPPCSLHTNKVDK